MLLKGTTSRLTAVEVADITTPEEHLARPPGEHSEGVGRDAVREFPESEPPRDPQEDARRGPLDLPDIRNGQSNLVKELAHAQESVPAG